MDFWIVPLLLVLVAFVAFLLLADGDLSLVVIEKFGKKLGRIFFPFYSILVKVSKDSDKKIKTSHN